MSHPATQTNLHARSPRISHRSRVDTTWIVYGLGVLLYGALFSLWQVEPAPLSVDAVGTLIAGLCLFPFAYWYRQGRHGIPMFELICVSFLLQYGNPVFLQPQGIVQQNIDLSFTWDQALQSLLVVAAGMFVLVVSYYAVGASRLAQRMPHIDLRLAPFLRGRYLVVGTLVGLIFTTATDLNIGRLPSSIASFSGIFQNQLTIAVIIIGFRVYSGATTGFRWRAFLYIAVTVEALIGLGSGALELALNPVILLLLIKWTCTRKLSIAPIVIGALLVVLLNSVKQEYRHTAWFGSSISTVNKLTLWGSLSGQAVQDLAQGDMLNNTQTLVRRSMSRFDMFHTLELIQQETPGQVPYLKGSSYTYFLYTWVPRFVWPDKPQANGPDTDAAVSYGLMTQQQIGSVSIGLGQLGLGYANFGLLGVLAIMAIEGMIFALLKAALDGPESEGGRAMYLTVVVPFLNGVGGSTAILFGGMVQTLVVNGLILKMFTSRPKLWNRGERRLSQSTASERQSGVSRRGPIGAVTGVAVDVNRSLGSR